MSRIGDNLQPAYPNNSHRQDWAYYPFVGGKGGGASYPAATVSRYSFWVDFDPFDVRNTKMLSQNVQFQIFNDTYGDIALIPWYIISQNNDMSDELIESILPTTQGQSASKQTAVGQFSITYPACGYVDTGAIATYTNSAPPASTTTDIGLTAATSTQGELTDGQTYYYWVQWTDASSVNRISLVASATPSGGNQSIGLTFNPQSGVSSYYIYRNTVNDVSSSEYLTYMNPGQPPYYIFTNFTSQVSNPAYINDQGSFTFDGYQGYGSAFGGTTMLAQGFVPTQPQLTGLYINSIFNTASVSTYSNVNIELWNSSNQFVSHIATILPTYTPNGTTATGGICNDSNVVSTPYTNLNYTTTNGVNYWTSISQLGIKLKNGISVTVGSTYYIVVRLATLTGGTNYYYLGNNTGSSNTRSTYYYYPFANAYQATDGATSGWAEIVDANSKPITFPFITQGNRNRYATTYWWANLGTVYWPGTPNTHDYVYLHIDYNQRI